MNSDTLEQELFRHRPFLLRLAAGLVGSSDAEDLVQDVWTRALASDRPAPQSARAWLARVARNLATSSFRSQSRREQREREHAPAEGGSCSLGETAEHFELVHRIGAAVQTLEEPYRSVVLLRYFEGLEPAAIAANLGVPLATVRTRQQRALAQLREKLDREFGGREAWSVALGAWLARTLSVATATATVAVPWLALGGVAAAGLLALVVWRTQVGTPAQPELVQSATELVARVTGSTPGTAPSGAARERTDPTPQAVTQELEEPWRRIVGTLVGLTPEELARTQLRVQGTNREFVFPAELVAVAAPSVDGAFTVDLAPLYLEQDRHVPQELLLYIDEPRHMLAEVRLLPERGETDVDGNTTFRVDELSLALAALVRGVLTNEAGQPVAGADIEAFRMENGLPLPDERGATTSDEEGRFVLRIAEEATHALVALEDGLRPATRIEAVFPGQELELGTLRLERGAVLSGTTRVLGVPQGGIDVHIHPEDRLHRVTRRGGGGSIGFVEGSFEWSDVRVESGASGEFAAAGLAPRDYRLYGYSLSGTRGTLGRRPLETRAAAPADGVELEFDGARITLDIEAPFDPETHGRVHVESPTNRTTMTFRLGDGPVRFVAPTGERLVLRVELDGSDSSSLEIETPGPGEELRRSLALSEASPAALHLVARSDAGRVLQGLALELYPGSGPMEPLGWRSPSARQVFELVDGEATITVAPGEYRVSAQVHEPALSELRSFHVPLEFRLSIAAGEEARRELEFVLGGFLRVDLKRPGGIREQVQFRLLDALGNELPRVFHSQDPVQGTISGLWYLEPWGPNDLVHALPPGAYTLRVWDEDVVEQQVPFTLVAGETTELTVTLEPR